MSSASLVFLALSQPRLHATILGFLLICTPYYTGVLGVIYHSLPKPKAWMDDG